MPIYALFMEENNSLQINHLPSPDVFAKKENPNLLLWKILPIFVKYLDSENRVFWTIFEK